MQFVQALVAAVGEQFQAPVQIKFTLFVKSEIVYRASPVCRANDLTCATIDDDLRL
jgi:hypothetical protein